jgi:hypothetical protein
MTALPCDTASRLPAADRWDRIRSAVFWLAIAVILIMPGILSMLVLLRLHEVV